MCKVEAATVTFLVDRSSARPPPRSLEEPKEGFVSRLVRVCAIAVAPLIVVVALLDQTPSCQLAPIVPARQPRVFSLPLPPPTMRDPAARPPSANSLGAGASFLPIACSPYSQGDGDG